MQDICLTKDLTENEVKLKKEDIFSRDYQEARAFLRERTLRLLSGIVGKQCVLHTIESTVVTGEFKGCDLNIQEFYIKNLKTPIGTLPDVIVRDKDIVKICLPNICD